MLGPHEHHSNILPWRESAAKVVHIGQGPDGTIDRGALRAELHAHAHHSLVIGSFSAASNVTGVIADVDGITEELHRAGALAFWDYAAAAGAYTPPLSSSSYKPFFVGYTRPLFGLTLALFVGYAGCIGRSKCQKWLRLS